MFDKKTLTIYAFIIGAFFIVSGVGKVIDTAGFSNLISQYGLGYLKFLSPIIVLVEILIGLFLVLSVNPKRYSFFSFVLLVIFTILFAYAYFKNGVTNCGCFGTLKYSTLPPIFSFIRNFILIGLTFIVWIKYPKEIVETENWKKYFILPVMVIAIFVSGYTFRIPLFMKQNNANQEFLKKHILETELSKYVSTSPDSTYLVFCFSYTCPHCLNSIENLKQYQKSNTVDRIIAIAVGEEKDRILFEQDFEIGFPIQNLSHDSMNEIAKVVPTSFFIKNDTIQIILPSALPSFVVFKKYYLQSK